MTPVYGIAMTCESSFGIYQCHCAGSDRTALTSFQTSNMHETYDKKLSWHRFWSFVKLETLHALARIQLDIFQNVSKQTEKLNHAMRLPSQCEPLTVYHDQVMLTVWVPQNSKMKITFPKSFMPVCVSHAVAVHHITLSNFANSALRHVKKFDMQNMTTDCWNHFHHKAPLIKLRTETLSALRGVKWMTSLCDCIHVARLSATKKNYSVFVFH